MRAMRVMQAAFIKQHLGQPIVEAGGPIFYEVEKRRL